MNAEAPQHSRDDVSLAELARPAMERMVAKVKERAARAGVIPVTRETWPAIQAAKKARQ
ncbi:MAG: hypothetical protein E1N59_1884 [Puniceicoccaceae bacterium 5H]|nr:MAG: hypothetical protein E1N59_1884 [Puniceicoccaceae bacterium 5H]